ncbi:MAG: hypothetical protein L3J21_11235 [Devosiaceae bacterium]|nr:hypothetical protein [Devosiaceae bacterium]
MNSTAATPQKFAFDLDMSQDNQNSRLIGEVELSDMLRDAEEKGYKKGLVDGENSAANRNAANLVKATSDLAKRTMAIAKTSDDNQKQILHDAALLGVSTGRKLAANLIARFPLSEIRALIGECLSSLESVPHLVIRCHPDLANAIEVEAKKLMSTSGFDGRLIIMGEPEILLGDARLEWVNGGLVRDMAKISSQIDQHVKSFIEAQNAKTFPPTGLPTTENDQ